MLEAIGVSECGPIRSSNEDSIYLNPEVGLFIVADGMGGLERGKEVSAAAAELFATCCLGKPYIDSGQMVDCLEKTNYQLYEETHIRQSEGGTTFTAVYINNSSCKYVHIGDSRLYHFEAVRNRLQQKTFDHTLAAELERGGTSAQATQQFRHILTRSLGTSNQIESTQGDFRTVGGDLLLLCSDGFWQVVDAEELANYFAKISALDEIANNLKKKALSRNPRDNFSFIIVKT